MDHVDSKHQHLEEPWRGVNSIKNSEEPWHKNSSIRKTNSKKASIMSNKFYADYTSSGNKENNPFPSNCKAYQNVY